MKALSLLLALVFSLPASAQLMLTGAGKKVSASHSLASVSCPGTGSTSSTITCSGTYTGTAPSTSGWTYSWNSTCSGSGSVTSIASVSGGNITGIVFATPSGVCTGTVTLTDNLSDSATSGSVVISGAYVGPGDIVSGAYFWYGMRAYSAAVAATGTQKAINVIRASGSVTCDLIIGTDGLTLTTANCSTGATDNGKSCATFVGGSSLKSITWYDQSGNGRDATDPGSSLRPAVGCTGGASSGAAYVSFGGGLRLLLPASTMSSPQTIVQVVKNATTTYGWAISFGPSGGQIGTYYDGAGHVSGYAGSAVDASATDSAWHAAQAILNSSGGNGSMVVDGSVTTGATGTAALSSAAGAIGANWQNGSPVSPISADMEEIGAWNSKAFSTGGGSESALMNSNIHSVWGF